MPPIPLWVLKFLGEHGRYPKPNEVPNEARQLIRRCVETVNAQIDLHIQAPTHKSVMTRRIMAKMHRSSSLGQLYEARYRLQSMIGVREESEPIIEVDGRLRGSALWSFSLFPWLKPVVGSDFCYLVWDTIEGEEEKVLKDNDDVRGVIKGLQNVDSIDSAVTCIFDAWITLDYRKGELFRHTPGVIAVIYALSRVNQGFCMAVAEFFADVEGIELGRVRNYSRRMVVNLHGWGLDEFR